MPRSTEYSYNPDTGEWTKSTSEGSSYNSGSSDKSGDNLTSTTSSGETGTGKVEKKYNDNQINTLEGTLVFIVTEETIKLKAGDTVALKGLGKYLSGKYYVKDITRSIGSDGYSHSATLIKTDFGSTLKIKSSKKAPVSEKTESSPSTSGGSTRKHTVQKGEYLWSIAYYYYGDGSLYTKIVDANSKVITDPNNIKVGTVLVIP